MGFSSYRERKAEADKKAQAAQLRKDEA